MDKNVKTYLAEIGRVGGKKSRRTLSKDQARQMVKVREAKKAFKEYYSRCFWHLKSDLEITEDNLYLIIKGLKNYGDRRAFLIASKLCQ